MAVVPVAAAVNVFTLPKSVLAFTLVYSLKSVTPFAVLYDFILNEYAVSSASPFTVNVSVVLFFVVASAVHFPPLYCSIT